MNRGICIFLPIFIVLGFIFIRVVVLKDNFEEKHRLVVGIMVDQMR